LQSNVLDHHQFSEEIRLHGVAASGSVDWTAGLFYFDAGSVNRGPVDLSVLSWVFPSLDFVQDDSSNVRNESIFVDGTWHATRRLNFTAGVRSTHERKDYTFRHLSFIPDVPSLVPPTKTEVSYSRVNPRVVIDYRLLPRLMTYASFSTGFRAGGFNGRPFGSEQVIAFGPERLLSYEIGAKSEWLDRRLRLNAAAFFSDYRDLQLSILTVDATGQPFSAPANIGRAHITGGEIEVEAQPIAALRLVASFGFQEFEATALGAAINCDDVSNPVPTPAPGGNCTIDGASLGKPVPFIPRKTASAAAEYIAPLPRGGSLLIAAHLSYESVSYTDAVASREGAVPSRVLLDGRIAWRSPESRWVVTLSGTNLTDRRYYINKRNLIGLWGQVLGQPGRPREWGLSVAREFGNSSSSQQELP
jgi:iron complex outermembrane receptor protein